ncbi:response regulator transcription factor [Streptomyces sp. KCTC 0041BP]|uniref:helix-turn-helix transcriptional regulator n=1 Tax=Streptomyces sp. KCTC 0041BP TaxID=201500 RepID=UPI001AE17C83|nr:response regulator transcription factor [Streptomyces sp. KCTC 0041BP]MBP0937928.1 response regulator transcription factor [Streptomyces sp. KCTC 0041BP]
MPVLTDRTDHVTVTIHAADPLSRAGVLSLLDRQPAVRVVPWPPEPEGDGPAAEAAEARVAVMLIDQIDERSTAELRRLLRGGERRVVLVARELRESELFSVVEYGVQAIVWRHQATEERLVTAVRQAAQGECVLPPDVIGRVLGQMHRLRRSQRATTPPGAACTTLFGMAPRETDVLRLISEGLDTRQISEKLCYSERTVKNILHGLMTRLRLNNRAHAVAYALREGYI